jgi:hypothetical protein
VKKGGTAIPQGLIKWSNIDAAAATWEDLTVLKDRFPDFRAWGQAQSQEGATVTPDAESSKT